VKAVPLFDWGTSNDAGFWLSLASAWKSGLVSRIPAAPGLDSNCWAISGMTDLDDAISWAASSTRGSERDRWLFQLGAWLAARGETGPALETLTQSGDDRARALAGRLWLAQRAETCTPPSTAFEPSSRRQFRFTPRW
jgi:hypothetical protein